MLKRDVRIGGVYWVKVSGKVQKVQILWAKPDGGWGGKNLDTGREIRIRTAGRLRGEVKSEPETRLEYGKVYGENGVAYLY